MKKIFLSLLVALIFLNTHAQENKKPKLNIWLKEIVNNPKNKGEILNLVVQGNVELIERAIPSFGGRFRYSFKDYSAISIPIEKLSDFSSMDYVKRIEFSLDKPFMLNDTSKINNNVIAVHQGLAPLSMPYKGDDIILGIVDTNIDLSHPDFKDSLGNTRILAMWNQNTSGNAPLPYGYGAEYSYNDINSGNVTQPCCDDHGSHVTGIAAGNGKSVAQFSGMAPNADIIFVDYYSGGFQDWKYAIGEAVDYIFNKADFFGKPAVVNLSIGTYRGAHDGLDAGTQLIEQGLNEKEGRIVVCAAGNSGLADPYHLSYPVNADTSFTWFKHSSSLWYPFQGIIFEVWADTADFNTVNYAFGMDDPTNNYNNRGRTAFKSITLGDSFDTLISPEGNYLGVIGQWAELIDGRYFMQFYMVNPDSSQYYLRFSTTGQGKFNVWSIPSYTGSSPMVSAQSDSLPTLINYPEIAQYQSPDSLSSLVTGWACSPKVVTVGSYLNRNMYVDYIGNTHYTQAQQGTLFETSSLGPTRTGLIKPDITAPGAVVFSCGMLSNIAQNIVSVPEYVAPSGFHKVNTGTSMASPAVAGIAALFLQKCPNANYQDFIDALQGNGRADQHTGILPNNYYGYGKVDAFDILVNSQPKAPLNTSDTSVCNNFQLTLLNTYDSYLWSNGSQTMTITIDSSGIYYVKVDSLGCVGYSDTVEITIDPTHIDGPNLILNGPSTFCEGENVNLQIVEIYNSIIWSDGQIGNSIVPNQTGFYYAEVLDSNDCQGISDSILIVKNINPPQPSIAIFDTLLVSSIAGYYQWYYEDQAIAGATQREYAPIADSSGNYRVETFLASGCSALSDPVYYSKPSGINTSNKPSSVHFIYPNPATDAVIIKSNLNDTQTIENLKITNTLGEVVFNQNNLNQGQITIDLSHFARGTYVVCIQQNQKAHYYPLIVE